MMVAEKKRTESTEIHRNSLPVYLTLAEYTRLLSAATNDRDRLLIELTAHSGGRISEVLAACVGDLTSYGLNLRNLKQGIYIIDDRTPDADGGKWALRNDRKVKLRHVSVQEPKFIPFNADFLQKLRARVSGLPLDAPLIGSLRDSRPITRQRAWQIFKAAARQAGVQKTRYPGAPATFIWPHCLRHSFGTWMVEAGVPVPAVGQMMGHHSSTSTALYTRIAGPELREYVQRVKF